VNGNQKAKYGGHWSERAVGGRFTQAQCAHCDYSIQWAHRGNALARAAKLFGHMAKHMRNVHADELNRRWVVKVAEIGYLVQEGWDAAEKPIFKVTSRAEATHYQWRSEAQRAMEEAEKALPLAPGQAMVQTFVLEGKA
jgi:hypothetical protein